MTGYTYFMKVCLCKDPRPQLTKWQWHMQMGNIVPWRWKGLDINDKLWTVSFNILLCVMIWLIGEINSCGTVLPNQEVMSCDLGFKTLKIKLSDIWAGVGEFCVQLYGRTDEKCMYLTHMHQPPLERCFKDEHSQAIFERYSMHVGDHMAHSYSVSIQSSG